MKDVQCYELFGGIAHKNLEFSFSVRKNHNGTHLLLISDILSDEKK